MPPSTPSDSSEADKGKSTTEPAALRVVLLGDNNALHSYGPVLQRMTVGLIDEVGDLSLLCMENSNLLKHVPSPPVPCDYSN